MMKTHGLKIEEPILQYKSEKDYYLLRTLTLSFVKVLFHSNQEKEKILIKRKIEIYKISCIIIPTLFLVGCVPTEDSVSIQNDLLTIKNQLKSLQTSVDMTKTSESKSEITKIRPDLEAIKKNQADIKADIEELTENNQVFNSKLDEFNFRMTQLSQEIDLIQVRLSHQIKDSRSQIPEDKAGKDVIAILDPADIYRTSYNDYLKGNYDLAISGFQEYLKKFSGSPMAGNAQYWIGESYYSLKDFGKALEEFDKLINNYPKSNKVPSALLKKAYSYIELKRTNDAKEQLKDLIKSFPLTAEAKLAEGKLKFLEKD